MCLTLINNFRILPRDVIDPGHTRGDTTRREKKDRERGETGGGESETRGGRPAQERSENNRTESSRASRARDSRDTAERTAGTSGGRRRRARAGVEGIRARNELSSSPGYLYSL